MNLGSQSPRDVVDCVLNAWRAGTPDHAVVARVVQLGLSNEEAVNTLDLVRSGIERAALIGAGLQPNQITSDLDDNPIFRAAIDAGRLETSKTPRKESRDITSLLADLESADIETRRTAAYELGGRKERAATAGLVSALNDSDTYVCVYAIQSLSRLRSKDAVKPCLALLGSGAPRLVMVNAIKALAEIRDPNSVPGLIEATRHEEAFVRHDAAWALGEIGDPRAAPALEALLGDEVIPVQKDQLGLTTQTSIYSVADQARRSLKKLSAGRYNPGFGSQLALAVSLIFTAAGIVTLGVTWYAYFQQNALSELGLICGIGALILGVLGIVIFLISPRQT